jgi:prepilin-type N-terminal cleavage/methylation domain-containing protein
MKKSANINLNSKGFSLIELMIVVAIIGLLAAIGIPQYAKFQAKARQSEAKGYLTSIYTAESSFQSEWAGFSSNLVSLGVAATGVNLRYTAGFQAAACTITARSAGAPAEDTALTQLHLPAVSAAAVATWNPLVISGATLTFPGIVCTETTFTAHVYGDPKNTPTAVDGVPDRFTIDQKKLISNTAIGL